jgi:hypothetical protein
LLIKSAGEDLFDIQKTALRFAIESGDERKVLSNSMLQMLPKPHSLSAIQINYGEPTYARL